MANEIIHALDQCATCGKIINTNELSHEEHVRSIHENERITFKNYLGDILLAAGAGLMEKNLLLVVFTLCKQIFVSVIAKTEFISKNAQDFVTNVGDHHVSWKVFLIALQAFTKELLYVDHIDAISEGSSPSVSHLHTWKMDVKMQISNFTTISCSV